jgi:plasmid stabilization system protein ParE
MKVVWTEGAAEDLAEIVNHISQDSPNAARDVARAIFDGVAGLASFPNLGRKRMKDSFRELVFPRLSYIAVYEVIDECVFIHGIRHTSRDWGAM